MADFSFPSFELPNLGFLEKPIKNIIAFIQNPSKLNQLEVIGYMTIGIAVVVIITSILFAMEEQKHARRRM